MIEITPDVLRQVNNPDLFLIWAKAQDPHARVCFMNNSSCPFARWLEYNGIQAYVGGFDWNPINDKRTYYPIPGWFDEASDLFNTQSVDPRYSHLVEAVERVLEANA